MAQQDMPQKVGLQREHTVLSTGISEGQTTEELRKSGINCHAQRNLKNRIFDLEQPIPYRLERRSMRRN
jgi:hypothetical protein